MKIGVYGLGRFGYFWSNCLTPYFDVTAFSRSGQEPPKNIKKALSLNELFESDAVFLCNSISAIEDVSKEILPLVRPGMIILDTCSVKSYPMSILQQTLPESVSVIGTHPMFGPDSGKNSISNLPIVLSSGRQTFEEYDFWKSTFMKMGLKVIEMTPEDHDREAAYTQGITHFIGRTLKELGLEESQIATSGYKSLIDIVKQTCNDPWQLFVDLQKYNPYTANMRKDLHRAISIMLDRFDSIGTGETKDE